MKAEFKSEMEMYHACSVAGVFLIVSSRKVVSLQQNYNKTENSYMHYNVISSPCIPDPFRLASAIFWAHMNVTTII